MKNIILLLIVANYFVCSGQSKINIAKGYTSILSLPAPITDIKNGNDLEFNVKKSNSNFIEININKKAFPKNGTNLIVFTVDGSIYEIDLIVKPSVTNNIHIIEPSKASVVGKIKIEETKKDIRPSINSNNENQEVEETENSKEDTELDIVKKLCKENEKRKKKIIGVLNKSYNIVLSLRDVAYSGDMQYFYFDIRNKGGQSYDVEWINFYKSTSDNVGNSTNQKNLIDTFYIHNSPERIEGKSKYIFIAVMKKTSINENKTITVRIKELGGERNLILNVKHQIINNPTKL